jgi:glycerol-3-phosphate acyltransferase PlsY
MTPYVLTVLAAYLLGSLNGSLLLGRLRGVDIREQGSGNAGGTNALRTQGKAFALGVVLIDIGKAVVAVALLPRGLPASLWLEVSCALAAIIGHVYPIFHGFRGGKGVATVLGTLLALSPEILGLMVGVWLLALFIFGYVGLGSMLATASLPLLAWSAVQWGWIAEADLAPWVTFGVIGAAFVIYTHRSNIARMREGHEPRAKSLWLVGKWRHRSG